MFLPPAFLAKIGRELEKQNQLLLVYALYLIILSLYLIIYK
ncbi:hypothetical protein SAMN05660206_10443 [Sphingobacterium wenxiniae]|uniref:Uncharacterized protein n=1 Tax=Sphingobacterium wenxiniae TaxID=683125 RepID=A0A1I6RZP3_9SPHI|nr:hypothetical protein SAMN05660206_10443 [Sphingobacterium wenxiniae]